MLTSPLFRWSTAAALACCLGTFEAQAQQPDQPETAKQQQSQKPEAAKKNQSAKKQPAKRKPKAMFPAITVPAEGGTDYALQGEYVGTYTDDGIEEEKVGYQVVALSDGKFRIVGYRGGLPGDGYNGEPILSAEGEMNQEGKVLFTHEEGAAVLDEDGISIHPPGGGVAVGHAKSVLRRSPTLGKEPPKGAVVLFNGKSANKFVDGQMTEENCLKVGTQTKRTFGDFELHLEFKTPFMPTATGQRRGNSGVYLQGRYEVQVLDSFGCEGLDNECGGIYKQATPKVNMCFPPLTWQTYDITFTAAKFDKDGKKTDNARVNVLHNGVLIHDDVELTTGTQGGPLKEESTELGPIYFQSHTEDPVVYNNIWIVDKSKQKKNNKQASMKKKQQQSQDQQKPNKKNKKDKPAQG
ncbi:DUF1080 domain-containing protein [Planctomycetales bacterium 10988]|nr:DUF1080 domain-containing protein [Planctomycetales bacterium 10988]